MRFPEEWHGRLRATVDEQTCSDCFQRVPPGEGVEAVFTQDELDSLSQRGLPPGEHAFCAGRMLATCEARCDAADRKIAELYGAKRR